MEPIGRLAAIYHYPVKSLASHALEETVVERRGLKGDRRWMLVDASGDFISQREFPQLSLCEATPTLTGLTVSVPDHAELVVPTPSPTASPIRTRIWRDSLELLDAGEPAAGLFSDYLDEPVRLVFQTDNTKRPIDARFRTREDDHVSLADGYPLLLTARESLEALNARMDKEVAMIRFRPNLVVAGFAPFDEDRWLEIRIGALTFAVAKPCARCQVVNIDPQTGIPGREPLRTLSTFRRDERGKVLFGQNLIPTSTGRLKVDDPVQVVTSVTV